MKDSYIPFNKTIEENAPNAENVSTDQQRVKKQNNENILYILYGSRTGNSKAAAILARDYARYLGLESYLLDMKIIDPQDLQHIRNLLIAVSTHGEGDPPAVVENFYKYIHSPSAPSMEGAHFSVLALGDSSYRDFCKTGRDFQRRLKRLGAKEISPLVSCDIDYEENAKKWVEEAVASFAELLPAKEQNKGKPFAFEINKNDAGFENAYYAKVRSKKYLTLPGFGKRTLHLELAIDNFDTPFQPGDSFGVYLSNSRLLVDKLLKVLGFDGTHTIEAPSGKKMLKEALINDFEITMLTPLIVRKYAQPSGHPKITELTRNAAALQNYALTHDVLDLVTDYPATFTPEEFINILRKLNPRLYSVASSPSMKKGELHFTIGLVEYNINQRNHIGVGSAFFADRVEEGDSIPVYLESNPKFRLPENTDTPIIMIGTGTGIAPFRAFLQERKYQGAKGENWLFFGDRNAESDYLYRDELEDFFNSGLLTKLNTAFSRDQQKKIYVQQRMLENSAALYNWIFKRNAAVYLCGNKRTMGKSVRETMKEILINEGNFTTEEAVAYLKKMKNERRLQADLY